MLVFDILCELLVLSDFGILSYFGCLTFTKLEANKCIVMMYCQKFTLLSWFPNETHIEISSFPDKYPDRSMAKWWVISYQLFMQGEPNGPGHPTPIDQAIPPQSDGAIFSITQTHVFPIQSWRKILVQYCHIFLIEITCNAALWNKYSLEILCRSNCIIKIKTHSKFANHLEQWRQLPI